ncbi:MAG: alpha/beta fold hydrolase, partial [Acidimicrobiia bacterium]
SFDEILERTVAFNPTRSVSSLRRGILHNAAEQPDGTWAWRYERFILPEGTEIPDFGDLWHLVDAVDVPLLLVRGADSPVVGDEDVVELLRRRPEARVVVVDAAGHSVQGDQPLELAALIEEHRASPTG